MPIEPSTQPVMLWELAHRQLPARADHPALIQAGEAVPYASLARRVEGLARWLAARGVGAGDRVGLALGPCVDEVTALLALARLDAVFVGVFHRWKPHQILHVVADSGARALLLGARQAREIEAHGLPEGIDLLVPGEAPDNPRVTPWPDALEPGPLSPPPRDPRALRALLYTSGSTGQPKGLMISDQALVVCARGIVDYLDYGPDERVLASMPLAFSYGLSQVTSDLFAGATAVLHQSTLPAELLAVMEEQQVSVLAGVPAFWHLLLTALEEHPRVLPRLRLITNAGGAPTRRMIEAWPRLLPGARVVLLYGQTEMLRGTWLPPDRFAAKPGALGLPVPDQRLWLIDPERGICGPGEVGEVVVHGPMVCQGYWKLPQQTERHLKPSAWLAGEIEEPVWHSGDLAERDADGVLWFSGRRDSLIKSAGFRVSPTEIESLAVTLPGVQDAVAFGIPDPELGQAVVLAVSPGPAHPSPRGHPIPTAARPARLHGPPGDAGAARGHAPDLDGGDPSRGGDRAKLRGSRVRSSETQPGLQPQNRPDAAAADLQVEPDLDIAADRGDPACDDAQAAVDTQAYRVGVAPAHEPRPQAR